MVGLKVGDCFQFCHCVNVAYNGQVNGAWGVVAIWEVGRVVCGIDIIVEIVAESLENIPVRIGICGIRVP